MTRCLIALPLLAALVGCGLLFPPDPLDFRPYTLKGVPYEEAVSLVQDVLVAEFQERFGGGFQSAWDAEEGNLTLDGVRDDSGNLRLTLYVKLVPQGADTVVEMFAVVRELHPGTVAGQPYIRPKQAPEFEGELYDALVLEVLNRRAPPPGS